MKYYVFPPLVKALPIGTYERRIVLDEKEFKKGDEKYLNSELRVVELPGDHAEYFIPMIQRNAPARNIARWIATGIIQLKDVQVIGGN